MKSRAKRKSAKTRVAPKSRHRPVRAKARPAKAARAATARRAAPAQRLSYSAAIQGIQDAAASLSDADLIEILSDLSWPSRAKWLSSYFADRMPEETLTDDEDAADAVSDLGMQVAALLQAMEVDRPTDFLSAVTYALSADPSHVDEGLAWLEDHLGTRTIDLGALEELPGYQAVAEIVERMREGPDAV